MSPKVITCAQDAAGLDFLVLDALLSDDDCDLLSGLHAANAERYLVPNEVFWQGRLLGYREVRAVSPTAAVTIKAAVRAAVERVGEFYGAGAQLYPDVVHLVGWGQGQSMPLHSDNANPDGSPHGLAHRAFSGVIYLTGGQVGGDLELPGQGVVVRPQKGMLVSLPGGLSHMHAVTRLISGRRTTMAFFLTFDPERADHEIFTPDPAA